MTRATVFCNMQDIDITFIQHGRQKHLKGGGGRHELEGLAQQMFMVQK